MLQSGPWYRLMLSKLICVIRVNIVPTLVLALSTLLVAVREPVLSCLGERP